MQVPSFVTAQQSAAQDVCVSPFSQNPLPQTATQEPSVWVSQQSLGQAITALRTAQQQIVLQQQSVAAAEEDLRVQQERYQLGVSTLLDVLTSQNQLNQATLALVQARFSARTARAQLEQLVGRDL